MSTPIGSILRQAFRDEAEKYNVLTFPTHERYQSNLANTRCNYFLMHGDQKFTEMYGVKGNGWVQSYAQMPNNHILLDKTENPLHSIPSWVDLDFTFGQHKFGQVQLALQIGNHFKIPTIALEHTTVTNENLARAVPQLKEIRGDINVFISESSAQAWGWDLSDPSVVIIHHGVDSEKLFRPLPIKKDQPYILCIANDWVSRGDILGWDIFQRVVGNNKLPCRILGDTAGVSRPAKNVHELVQEYNNASVFYNTSRFSPIPSVMLEAMACGLPVVTTDNFLISEVIVDGVNGYKTNSEDEQLRHLQRLLSDKEERETLGANARKTIQEDFTMKKFIDNWNNVFDRASRIRK